jgi:hypothetical protein
VSSCYRAGQLLCPLWQTWPGRPLVRDSFVEAARDLRDESWLPEFPVEVAADFDGYVRRVLAEEHDWGVPMTTLWYIDRIQTGH